MPCDGGALHERAEREAVDDVDGEEVGPVDAPEVEHLDDVRVNQARGEFGFVPEEGDEALLLREVGVDAFDRHRPLEAAFRAVDRLVDRAHPAGRDVHARTRDSPAKPPRSRAAPSARPIARRSACETRVARTPAVAREVARVPTRTEESGREAELRGGRPSGAKQSRTWRKAAAPEKPSMTGSDRSKQQGGTDHQSRTRTETGGTPCQRARTRPLGVGDDCEASMRRHDAAVRPARKPARGTRIEHAGAVSPGAASKRRLPLQDDSPATRAMRNSLRFARPVRRRAARGATTCKVKRRTQLQPLPLPSNWWRIADRLLQMRRRRPPSSRGKPHRGGERLLTAPGKTQPNSSSRASPPCSSLLPVPSVRRTAAHRPRRGSACRLCRKIARGVAQGRGSRGR